MLHVLRPSSCKRSVKALLVHSPNPVGASGEGICNSNKKKKNCAGVTLQLAFRHCISNGANGKFKIVLVKTLRWFRKSKFEEENGREGN